MPDPFNLPFAPVDHQLALQPNGQILEYLEAKGQWISAGTLNAEVQELSIGSIHKFPIEPDNVNWSRCDGAEVSRVTFANLFNVIGTTYGDGDGSTTFNLPDYRGRFVRDTADGSGYDPDAASRLDRGDGVTGDAVGTTQEDENLSHNHGSALTGISVGLAGNHRHGDGTAQDNSKDSSTTAHVNRAAATTVYTNFAGTHSHALNGEHSHPAVGGNEFRPVNVNVSHYIYTGAGI